MLGQTNTYKNITKVSQLENDVPYALKSDVEVEIEVPNGVYAVDANGKLIDYTTADNTAIGVALVAGEHKLMIAMNDATDGTYTTLYWGKNLYKKDVAGITNISSGADYIGEGKKYGTDFTTWSTGPVVDFNGAANTAAIIAGYTEHGVSMDARDMCTVLNTFNASDSYNDWYVPAAGQLALMYLAKTDINAALAKIGGTAFESDVYWSSSEYDASSAWSVDFFDGLVINRDKFGSNRVRFVRDISVPKYTKPIKDAIPTKVSQLENDANYISNIKLNGNDNTGNDITFYAPNTGGSDGQILISKNGKPQWERNAFSIQRWFDSFTAIPNVYNVCAISRSTVITLPGSQYADEYFFEIYVLDANSTLNVKKGSKNIRLINDSNELLQNHIYVLSVIGDIGIFVDTGYERTIRENNLYLSPTNNGSSLIIRYYLSTQPEINIPIKLRYTLTFTDDTTETQVITIYPSTSTNSKGIYPNNSGKTIRTYSVTKEYPNGTNSYFDGRYYYT